MQQSYRRYVSKVKYNDKVFGTGAGDRETDRVTRLLDPSHLNLWDIPATPDPLSDDSSPLPA